MRALIPGVLALWLGACASGPYSSGVMPGYNCSPMRANATLGRLPPSQLVWQDEHTLLFISLKAEGNDLFDWRFDREKPFDNQVASLDVRDGRWSVLDTAARAELSRRMMRERLDYSFSKARIETIRTLHGALAVGGVALALLGVRPESPGEEKFPFSWRHRTWGKARDAYFKSYEISLSPAEDRRAHTFSTAVDIQSIPQALLSFSISPDGNFACSDKEILYLPTFSSAKMYDGGCGRIIGVYPSPSWTQAAYVFIDAVESPAVRIAPFNPRGDWLDL